MNEEQSEWEMLPGKYGVARMDDPSDPTAGYVDAIQIIGGPYGAEVVAVKDLNFYDDDDSELGIRLVSLGEITSHKWFTTEADARQRHQDLSRAQERMLERCNARR